MIKLVAEYEKVTADTFDPDKRALVIASLMDDDVVLASVEGADYYVAMRTLLDFLEKEKYQFLGGGKEIVMPSQASVFYLINSAGKPDEDGTINLSAEREAIIIKSIDEDMARIEARYQHPGYCFRWMWPRQEQIDNALEYSKDGKRTE